MADEAAAVPTPEEELPPEEQEEEQASTAKPKPKAPSARFGQLLMLGNDNWTVRNSDKDGVTVMRRNGNLLEERRISPEEYEKAKARTMPKDMKAKGSDFASRGLSAGASIGLPESLGGAARIDGYDAATGEVQLDIPGRGPTWVSKNTIQDLILPEGNREKGLETFAEAIGEEGPAKREAREQKAAADKKKKQTASAVAEAPATPIQTSKVPTTPVSTTPDAKAPPASSETTRAVRPTRSRDARPPVIRTPRQPRASVSAPSVPSIPKMPSAPSIGAAGTAGVAASVVGAVPAAASVGSAAASIKVPQPSIRETRAQMSADIKAVAPGAAQPAGGVSAKVPAVPSNTNQLLLYAQAQNALQVMGGRVASQRAAIQDMQGVADSLRNEISSLNAAQQTSGQPSGQVAGPYRAPARQDASVRIQELSKQLGDVNNRAALARFNLQADEARAQQLQIGTNLMRNAIPLVKDGKMPNFMVALVARSIPSDIPDPSPAQVGAFVAALTDGQSVAAPVAGQPAAPEPPPILTPSPRSYAMAPPSDFDRGETTAASIGRDGGLGARQVLQKRNLTLPAATAVAYSAAQQADRGPGGYQEGLGSADARTAAFESAGATGGRPVIDTIPQSYSADRDQTEAQKEEDIFAAGAGGPSSDFAKQQLKAQATQEQFLPGTTANLAGPEFEKETDRTQGIRNRPESEGGPTDQEAMRAAAYDAARQRARVGALSALSLEDEEGANAANVLKGIKQVESVRRNVSRMFDLFNAALAVATIETVLGAIWEIIVLLSNMNGRLLTAMFFRNPKSIVRRILPAAQIPYEAAAIVAVDFLMVAIVFLGACMLLAPFVIIIVIGMLGIGGLAFGVASS